MTKPLQPSTISLIEADYQKALLARTSLVFPKVRFFRRNVGLVTMQDGRKFRAGKSGQCDLYVLGWRGWHGEVELKRYGTLSPDQERWRDFCQGWDIPWILLEVQKGELPAATIQRWLSELKLWLVS